MEEWVAQTLAAAEYFFVWRVGPTVICGRNQEMDKEVDMDYCRKAGIDVVRRRSGGGCVYADMDNFMFSYVCPGDEIRSTFARYTTTVASVLHSLGVDARATGRNDIVVGDRKVSGNAFYHLPGRCIAHGTMLYDFNPAVMARAITPSRAKLESKSVQSVQSRVTSLRREGIGLSAEEFERRVTEALCDSHITLSAAEVGAIEVIESKYYNPEFLYRKGENQIPRAAGYKMYRRLGRIEGSGELNFCIYTDGEDTIRRMEVSGDFFLVGDTEEFIFRHFEGRHFDAASLAEAAEEAEPDKAVAGLYRTGLLHILTENT